MDGSHSIWASGNFLSKKRMKTILVLSVLVAVAAAGDVRGHLGAELEELGRKKPVELQMFAGKKCEGDVLHSVKVSGHGKDCDAADIKIAGYHALSEDAITPRAGSKSYKWYQYRDAECKTAETLVELDSRGHCESLDFKLTIDGVQVSSVKPVME